ncbi:hypothetical protein [Oceanobacillus iheyensis HTE831]|uniref:Uncharacterized protein n=2 Tax=Oceanobacillus iheyensis TaxID=182710 RepID=Q8ERH6_OCEIH|nr:hypothetical protein [Oceanobacillus iheyensis HTE831]
MAIGSVLPIGGTIIGGVIGFTIGTVGSMAFDSVYNNKDKIIGSVKDTAKKVGDAVTDFFGNLGSVFG